MNDIDLVVSQIVLSKLTESEKRAIYRSHKNPNEKDGVTITVKVTGYTIINGRLDD